MCNPHGAVPLVERLRRRGVGPGVRVATRMEAPVAGVDPDNLACIIDLSRLTGLPAGHRLRD